MPSTKLVSKKPSKKSLKDAQVEEDASVKAISKTVQEQDSKENDDDSEEEDSDEDDDVNEEGMAALMQALERNPLDDFERAQLSALEGDEDDESSEGEDSEDDEEVEGDEGEDEDEDEDVDIEDGDEDDEEKEEDDAIPLDELDGELDPDAVPTQKVQIDNELAMERIRATIALDASLPWTETLVVNYPHKVDVPVDDDLNRELAFYKQALESVSTARKLAASSVPPLPFSRPPDFFAEMVKSDAHMERIRKRLLDESSTMKRQDEKRREREGKKFGKEVQREKLKERERGKKEMEERVKGLKRKRKDILEAANGDDSAFDIAVEDALTDRPSSSNKRAKTSLPRHARDQKFGFGRGAGKRSKQNTRESTDAFVDGGRKRGGGSAGRGGRGGGRGGRGGASGGRGGAGGGGGKRLGKSRRMAMKSK